MRAGFFQKFLLYSLEILYIWSFVKKIQVFLLSAGLFFSGIFSGSVFANAGNDFVMLKKMATQEIRLSQLGIINQELLIFKTFEYENTALLQLGAINQQALILTLENSRNFSSENEDTNTLFFAELDIWKYLESFDDRSRGLDEYLFLAKSAQESSQKKQKFLENYLSSLQDKISDQKDMVEQAEKNFSQKFPSQNRVNIEAAKSEVVTQTAILTRMRADYAQKEYEYKHLSPSLHTLSQKIIAIEENRDALIFNVKTPENSGKFIGVIEQE